MIQTFRLPPTVPNIARSRLFALDEMPVPTVTDSEDTQLDVVECTSGEESRQLILSCCAPQKFCTESQLYGLLESCAFVLVEEATHVVGVGTTD